LFLSPFLKAYLQSSGILPVLSDKLNNVVKIGAICVVHSLSILPVYYLMPDIIITENGINKLLQNINIHKASGPDNIQAEYLKSALHK
jgi:hypothetical protein